MRLNSQGVNIRVHHRIQCCKDHAVPFNGSTTLKSLGNNGHVEVPTAGLGAFMTGVQMALIFHQELYRREHVRKPFLYRRDPWAAHGNTRLNGLTDTFL